MTSKIRVLDEHTINQIAAGEVIENPASVVKELVDNSIDAGATEITVEIQCGGRQLIRIIDNGSGMSSDDAVLSFERHATSKIKTPDDIARIYSMGFRGEAVPSIASISKYTLMTAPHSPESKGTMVIMEGGKMIKICEVICSLGTTVEVKSLFFNIPVRKKFQRSPSFDSMEILKTVTKFALAHPEIKFTLTDNGQAILLGKKPLSDDRESRFAERIIDILGNDFLEKCSYIENCTEDYQITGYIGLPGFTKHNRTGQYLFINKRPVFSHLVHNAIREGFGTTLPQGKHPQFVLHIDMSGDLVDINVHPQKKEVRLRQEQELKKALIKAVDEALHKSGIAPVMLQNPYPEETPECENTNETFAGFSLNPDIFLISESRNNAPSFFEQFPDCAPVIEMQPENPVPKHSGESFSFTPPSIKPRIIAVIPGYIVLDPLSLGGKFSEGLCLADQKAVHSRIIFEKICREKTDTPLEIQTLLIPHKLEVTPEEAAGILFSMDKLLATGIQIKQFGNTCFLIEGVPSALSNIDIVSFTRNLATEFQEDSDASSGGKDKAMASVASRFSMSGKTTLHMSEAQILMNRLFLCRHPYLCPFGKPTIITIGINELAKYFRVI